MEQEQVAGWIDTAVDYGIQILLILAIIYGASIVGGIVKRIVRRRFNKIGFDPTLGEFFLGLIKPLSVALGIVLALAVFGVEPTSFAAVIGAAGLAIGLALQGALGNVASGILILVFRPFKVGDYVEAGGEGGTVAEVSLFTTVLDTPQNIRVIVPNGVAIGGVIKNYSHHERRRVDIAVGTDYGADLAEVRRVLADAAASIPNVLEDPAPQIFLAGLGDSSINWYVRVWSASENYWNVFDQGTQIVKAKLDAAGIGIPFPQMDVHLDKLGD